MMDVEIRHKRACGPDGPRGGSARVGGALKPLTPGSVFMEGKKKEIQSSFCIVLTFN